uniref:Uncharacterized protein n=1 Tax=Microcebus murinus TaxID=30608 RepID=A0A8C5Y2R0_MICMU
FVCGPQILIFPLTIFFCFLNTNMFHTIVCVTTRVRIIYVAVTFVLLFFLDFIKKKKQKQNQLHTSPVLPRVWQGALPKSLISGCRISRLCPGKTDTWA